MGSIGIANAQEDASSMGDLLKQIEQGQARDSVEAQKREARFQADRNNQQKILNDSRAERTRQENRSEDLESTFADNQQLIVDARAALDKRLGALKELFGVLQTVSGDAQTRFNGSLTNIQYPNREAFLVELGNKMASANSLASIQDIEGLWYELQREISEQGKIARFTTEYASADGERITSDVVRIGVFNLVFEDGYLQYDTTTGNVTELQRQPEQSQYTNSAEDMMEATDGYVAIGLDVTRGGILALLVESPTITERINQGGIVGYCIIALGIVGLMIAVWRWISLTKDSRNVTAQLTKETASMDNPLGRVLSAYDQAKGADIETVELKLSEAALKEMPDLTKGLLFIKVIAAVAPLMGLLGTVTGMIKTFQVITLYGAGDPKLMAGGISQALMTTVLGLCVAIPMVLLHTLVSGQSRKIINILQSQSAGIVANHSENKN
ncbi:MAG: biopolymer transport protein ExbB [Woeseiaceae bacterium]|jgi:biopolymer transport protein ExbB|tara:strand:- start:24248 stop:25573 length:1326 start_codon:yes stop_codon:yes gene_type:complete